MKKLPKDPLDDLRLSPEPKFKSLNESIPEESKRKLFKRRSHEVTKSPTRSSLSSTISKFSRLSPTKQSLPLNTLLKPSFAASKSSIVSNEDVKPTKLEDFADTESSEDDDNDNRTDISSVLLEYFNPIDENLDSQFLFKESFDESSSMVSQLEQHPTQLQLSSPTKARIPSSKSKIQDRQRPPIEASSHNRDFPSPTISSHNRISQSSSEPSLQYRIAQPSIDNSKPNRVSQSQMYSSKLNRLSQSSLDNSKLNQISQSSIYSESDIIKRDSYTSSLHSKKFRYHHGKLEPISTDKDKRRILATSSNIEVNRYSLYNATNDSNHEFELKYPDPTVSPFHTPIQETGSSSAKFFHASSRYNSDFNSSSNSDNSRSKPIIRQNVYQSNQTTNISDSSLNLTGMNITMAPAGQSRNTVRSSMSTSELLYKLEDSYDMSENFESSNSNLNEMSLNKKTILGVDVSNSKLDNPDANLTAGVDSSSRLPFTLYKVHDKDYDESNQRWSVYEHRQILEPAFDSKTNKNKTTQRSPSTSRSGSHPSQENFKKQSPTNLSENRSSTTNTPSSTVPSRPIPLLPVNIDNKSNMNEVDEPTSRHSTPEPAILRDSLSRHNSHELMFNPEQNEDNPFNFGDIEKQLIDYYRETSYYSWTQFIIMMTLGLVICPLYFLISVGLLDYSSNKQYYSGLYYSGTKSTNHWQRRYSKTQKLLSFLIGIVWFIIVIAMIGVGLGLGTKS
jgi:hypothetical protein